MVRLHSVVLGILSTGFAFAQLPYDVWVDPLAGNDAASGALRSQAVRTIQAAWGRIPSLQQLSIPYRIRLVSGTYPADSVPTDWESRWGTAHSPVMLEAADGPGTAVLPSLHIYDCRYFYIVGIAITGSVNISHSHYVSVENSDISGASGFGATESHNIQFVNNVVRNTPGAGISVQGGHNILIAHNTLYRVGTRSPGMQANHNTAIYIYNNLLLNPPGMQDQWRTANCVTARGNIIWNGPANWTLSLGDPTPCLDANAVKPVFRNPATGDFRLAQRLAAPAFSIRGNPVTLDKAGHPRTEFTPGAYEFESDPAPPPSPITATPNPIRFVYTLGGNPPAAQSVTLTAAASATFSISPPVTWLTASPLGGATPSTLSITLNPTSFTTPGTQTSAFTITSTGFADLIIPVQVEVVTAATTQQTFTDVAPTSSFVDYVYLLSRFGITAGCSLVPAKFCPVDTVTQSQMAVFVLRSIAGDSFSYTSTPYFSDIPATHPMFKYIQKMHDLNINPGCGGGRFCPETPVTRGQMAQYVMRARYSGDVFPYPAAQRFTDVSTTDPLFSYVQKMWDLGITVGCSTTQYCPADSITREQMAAFILRAFIGYKLQTPTPAPSANAPQIAGCNIFPFDNVWNTPVDTLPVHSLSTSWVNTVGPSRTAVPDFGSGLYEGGPIGIPYVVVPQNQPRLNVAFDYDDESDPGPYPIPPNPPIEGGNASSGDRHILIVEQGSCQLWELYSTYPQTNGTWTAGSGAIFNLNTNGPLRPASWTSADAAGLPILPGLVRYDEVAAGEIRHAIRFTVPQTRKEFIWPARHAASSQTGSQYPPMGARFRLKAGFDISSYAPQVQVILRALKKYGMLLADNGSAWYLSGAPDDRWDNDMLRQIRRLTGNDFEAVDTSSMIVDVNSGQARQ